MVIDRRATKVWKRLVQAYGSRFIEAYGKDPNELWTNAIDDITDEQVAYGLRAVQRETPIHPPTLGQFVKACAEMPIAQHSTRGPSVQEQLCAYIAVTRSALASGAWTYLYREWTDPSRPKGMERCAECTGVLVPAHDGVEGFRVNTVDMLADAEGHAKAMRSFKPGPAPTETQMAAWRGLVA